MKPNFLAVPVRQLAAAAILCLAPVFAWAAGIADFAGSYAGSAEVTNAEGSSENRDMSVDISETDGGFIVNWTSVTLKEDGRRKEKSYEIEFQPSERQGIYSAAMKRDVFGHSVQLDPMRGEPYVWGRLSGDTLTVFSLFIAENGDYEMQQYDRTLADDGLELHFTSHRNGQPLRETSTFLARQ